MYGIDEYMATSITSLGVALIGGNSATKPVCTTDQFIALAYCQKVRVLLPSGYVVFTMVAIVSVGEAVLVAIKVPFK